ADRRFAWMIAAVLIGLPCAVAAFAKHGGTYNSLLLVFVPMTAVCIAALPGLVDLIVGSALPVLTALVLSLFLGASIWGGTFATPAADNWAFKSSHGDKKYESLVDWVAKSNLKVVCPDDPTI